MYKIIGEDQKEYGPVNADQLRQWIAEGRLTRRTRIKTEGETDWDTLGALPAFTSSFVAVPPVIPRQSTGSMLEKIIPYHNGMALAAYYLAVFSLIPFVGIILGIAGLIFGVLGLKVVLRNPAAGGKVHAWIGIVVGGLFGFGYLALTIVIVCAAAK